MRFKKNPFLAQKLRFLAFFLDILIDHPLDDVINVFFDFGYEKIFCYRYGLVHQIEFDEWRV